MTVTRSKKQQSFTDNKQTSGQSDDLLSRKNVPVEKGVENAVVSMRSIYERYPIKPCKVALNRDNFSKIGVQCSATSSDPSIQLSCQITQTNEDTIAIDIKRKPSAQTRNISHEHQKNVSQDVPETSTVQPSEAPSTRYVRNDTLLAGRAEKNRETDETIAANGKRKATSPIEAISKNIRKRARLDESVSTTVSLQNRPNLRFPRNVIISAQSVGKTSRKCKAIVRQQPLPKPVPCEKVQIGDVVLCKMRGFCEWPCLVTGLEANLIKIRFFGDNTTHKASICNFFKFQDSSDRIITNLRSKKSLIARELYFKAVREAEDVLSVPREISILNQID